MSFQSNKHMIHMSYFNISFRNDRHCGDVVKNIHFKKQDVSRIKWQVLSRQPKIRNIQIMKQLGTIHYKHFTKCITNLRSWLLLLALVQSEQGHSRDLHHLETAAGNISFTLSALSETRDQDLILEKNNKNVRKNAKRKLIDKLTFSSTKFKQPSLGTKQAIFFPFLMS